MGIFKKAKNSVKKKAKKLERSTKKIVREGGLGMVTGFITAGPVGAAALLGTIASRKVYDPILASVIQVGTSGAVSGAPIDTLVRQGAGAAAARIVYEQTDNYTIASFGKRRCFR